MARSRRVIQFMISGVRPGAHLVRSGRAECLDERREGATPMAYGRLLVRCRFREGSAEVITQEKRIVTESAGAPRLLQDGALTGPLEDFGNGIGSPQQDENGPVTRPSLRLGSTEQPAEELRVVGLVHLGGGAAGSGPALRADPGCAAQGEDFESRVVGHGGQERAPRKVFGLAARIAFERLSRFEQRLGALLQDARPIGKDDLVSRRLERTADLGLLSRAPRCHQQLHQPRTFRCAAKSSAMPTRPYSRMVSSSAREKVPLSPVPWTSTRRSGSSITMLASTSASRAARYMRSRRGSASTMPTLTAATRVPNGDSIPVRSASQAHASASATQPPVMLAVRVPPSACRTSQSTRMVCSPNAMVPMAARSERPIRRWISWVRPPGPLRSRGVRSLVARGSMAYSPVAHPSPVSSRKPGTPVSTLAVQWTSVPPSRVRQEPSA